MTSSTMLAIAIYARNGHHQYFVKSDKHQLFCDDNGVRLANGPQENDWEASSGSDLGSLRIECDSDAGELHATVYSLGRDVEITSKESDKQFIASGNSLVVKLPFDICVDDEWISVSKVSCEQRRKFKLRTIPRPQRLEGVDSKDAKLGKAPHAATLKSWFEALGALQRKASCSPEFLDDVVRSIVKPGGMDAGLLLKKQDDSQWQIRSSYVPDAPLGISFQMELLDRVYQEKRTLYHSASELSDIDEGHPAESVVASPVFDENDEVIGALYGVRTLHPKNRRTGIRSLEVQWIQLLAEAVSAGIARIEKEAEAARTRVLFEQAFSTEVVDALEQDPRILEGQERELTCLFADLRGFSEVSQRLGTKGTYELLSDVMDFMTDRVKEESGVIIDYYGDGLAAMWNAPVDQPNHAERACRAAKSILDDLPLLNEKWQEIAGAPLRVGMGINTGMALVGNAGSQRRLKYGPRGHSVNVASRIETATKHLKVPLLISERTRKSLPQTAVTRRVCKVRLPSLEEPLNLYELCSLSASRIDESLRNVLDEYDRALGLYEDGRFADACQLLEHLSSGDAGVSMEFLSNEAANLRSLLGDDALADGHEIVATISQK